MTLLDLTPEECRARDAALAKAIFERWAPLLSRLAEGPSEPYPAAHVEPWPIEWSPEGYAKPVPSPKGEA
jgi:hypothetical protein